MLSNQFVAQKLVLTNKLKITKNLKIVKFLINSFI